MKQLIKIKRNLLRTSRAIITLMIFTLVVLFILFYSIKNELVFDKQPNKDEKVSQKPNIIIKKDQSNAVLPEPTAFKDELKLSEVEIQKKLSRMLIFGVDGTSISKEEQNFLSVYKPLGVLLFTRNIQEVDSPINSDKLKIISELDKIYWNFNLSPIISIDQEGGLVKRIIWDEVGSASEIAKLSREKQCAEWEKRDTLLSELGIDWNFGLVADFTDDESSFIYPRIFSQNLDVVSQNVEVAIECTTKTKTTVKHYPGHGSTTLDTHLGSATLTDNSIDEWSRSDLVPFVSAISSGVDSIMMGHLRTKFMDSEKPASLSKKHINYLRGDLGFDGLIVTDDLFMLVNNKMTIEEAFYEALLAGNDVLLTSISDVSTKEQIIKYMSSEIMKLDSYSMDELLNSIDLRIERIDRIITKRLL